VSCRLATPRVLVVAPPAPPAVAAGGLVRLFVSVHSRARVWREGRTGSMLMMTRRLRERGEVVVLWRLSPGFVACVFCVCGFRSAALVRVLRSLWLLVFDGSSKRQQFCGTFARLLMTVRRWGAVFDPLSFYDALVPFVFIAYRTRPEFAFHLSSVLSTSASSPRARRCGSTCLQGAFVCVVESVQAFACVPTSRQSGLVSECRVGLGCGGVRRLSACVSSLCSLPGRIGRSPRLRQHRHRSSAPCAQ
jgi:hypothetical protein